MKNNKDLKSKKEKASLVSVFVNAVLGLLKISVGLFINSTAIIADGLHSVLDILSSAVSYAGIKFSQKKQDERHHYGYHSAESIAGFLIALLLAGTGVLIIAEGAKSFFNPEKINLNFYAYAVVVFSIIVNEIIARYKLKIGQNENSLALVADAKHSRADAVSSVGVLFGLFLVPYFSQADSLMAILIGAYILYESWDIGKETTDQLIGVHDEEVEKKIEEILHSKHIKFSEIKTKKIGATSLAEIDLILNADLKIEEAEKISQEMQSYLLENVENLDYVVTQLRSHSCSVSSIKSQFGGIINWRKKIKEEYNLEIAKKNGYRIAIPVIGKEIPKDDFGSREYVLLDVKDKKIINEQRVKNPFFSDEGGAGFQAVLFFQADEAMTKHIGPSAAKKAKENKIKITILKSEETLKNIYEKIIS